MTRNPDRMTYDEIALEVSDLQGDIQTKSRRIFELATAVHRRARREPADDNTAIYLTYANAMNRYAGTVDRVSIRSHRSAKVLNRVVPPEPTLKKPNKEKKVRAAQQPELSPMESLMDSYGSGNPPPKPPDES